MLMANEGYHETYAGSGVYTPNANFIPSGSWIPYGPQGSGGGQVVFAPNTIVRTIGGNTYSFNASTGQQMGGGALPPGYAYNPVTQSIQGGQPLPTIENQPYLPGAKYYSAKENKTYVGLSKGNYKVYSGKNTSGYGTIYTQKGQPLVEFEAQQKAQAQQAAVAAQSYTIALGSGLSAAQYEQAVTAFKARKSTYESNLGLFSVVAPEYRNPAVYDVLNTEALQLNQGADFLNREGARLQAAGAFNKVIGYEYVNAQGQGFSVLSDKLPVDAGVSNAVKVTPNYFASDFGGSRAPLIETKAGYEYTYVNALGVSTTTFVPTGVGGLATGYKSVEQVNAAIDVFNLTQVKQVEANIAMAEANEKSLNLERYPISNRVSLFLFGKQVEQEGYSGDVFKMADTLVGNTAKTVLQLPETVIGGLEGITFKVTQKGGLTPRQKEVYTPLVEQTLLLGGMVGAGAIVAGTPAIASTLTKISASPVESVLFGAGVGAGAGFGVQTMSNVFTGRSWLENVPQAVGGGALLGGSFTAVSRAYTSFKVARVNPVFSRVTQPELVLSNLKGNEVGYRFNFEPTLQGTKMLVATGRSGVISESELFRVAGTSNFEEALGVMAKKGVKINSVAVAEVSGFIQNSEFDVDIGGRIYGVKTGGSINTEFKGAEGGHQRFAGVQQVEGVFNPLDVSENIKPLAGDASKTAFRFFGKVGETPLRGGGITSYGKVFTSNEALTKAFEPIKSNRGIMTIRIDYAGLKVTGFKPLEPDFVYSPRSVRPVQSQLVNSMYASSNRFVRVGEIEGWLKGNSIYDEFAARATLDIKGGFDDARIINLIESDRIRLPGGSNKKGAPFSDVSNFNRGSGGGGQSLLGATKQKVTAFVSSMTSAFKASAVKTALGSYSSELNVAAVGRTSALSATRAVTKTSFKTISMSKSVFTPLSVFKPVTQTISRTQPTTLFKPISSQFLKSVEIPQTKIIPRMQTVTKLITIQRQQLITVPKITPVTKTGVTPIFGGGFVPVEPPPFPGIGFPLGGLGSGSFSKRGGNFTRGLRLATKYTPDFTSKIFNIRGRQPKGTVLGYSGAELRPILGKASNRNKVKKPSFSLFKL